MALVRIRRPSVRHAYFTFFTFRYQTKQTGTVGKNLSVADKFLYRYITMTQTIGYTGMHSRQIRFRNQQITKTTSL